MKTGDLRASKRKEFMANAISPTEENAAGAQIFGAPRAGDIGGALDPGSGHGGLGLEGFCLLVTADLLQEGAIVLSQVDSILVLGIPLGINDLQGP